LTEAGTLFLSEARAIFGRVEMAELALAELAGLKRGTLTVQASQTIASFWLPSHLVTFRRAYPHIDVRLSIGNTAQVAAAILAGASELGFVEGDVTDAALVSRPVARAIERGRAIGGGGRAGRHSHLSVSRRTEHRDGLAAPGAPETAGPAVL
jgi:DNA-binding transcriptional LysR family regulator